jgi:hypothetical protein
MAAGWEPPFIAGEVSRRQQWQLIVEVPSETEGAPKSTWWGHWSTLVT